MQRTPLRTKMQDYDKQSSEMPEDGADNGHVKIHTEAAMVSTHDIDENALVRKVDLTLIPWLCFVYLLCFLDRVGIGNARVRI